MLIALEDQIMFGHFIAGTAERKRRPVKNKKKKRCKLYL
jgi:hypothetical protein